MFRFHGLAMLVLLSVFGGASAAQDWAAADLGDTAARAAVAGNEADGTPIFVIRSMFHGGTTPGKFIPVKHAAYVPWGGLENSVKTFELFVGKGRWVPNSSDAFPADAVQGGQEADGSVLYVIRSSVGKALVPGKYSTKTLKAYIPWDGKELEVKRYEVLVSDPAPPAAVEWAPSDVTNNASAAVPAGRSPDGTPSYLIRSSFQGSLIPGKYNPRAKAAYVAWGGKENKVTTFELYVGKGRWTPGDAAGPIPSNAVPAGNEADGTPLLAIRSPAGKALVPGKFNVKTRQASFSLGGKEVKAEQFEFLVRDDAPLATVSVPQPTVADTQMGGSDGASEGDLVTAVMSPTTLVAKPLVIKGGQASTVGELNGQDFRWQGNAVDAYDLRLDSGTMLILEVNTVSNKPDARAILLDPQGQEVGTPQSGPGFGWTRFWVTSKMSGLYHLVVIQKSADPVRYAVDLQELDFTVEGDLAGGVGPDQESLVPLAWNPAYAFWNITVDSNFQPEFELLDPSGKEIARSQLVDGKTDQSGQPNQASARVIRPKVRGMGSIKITSHFATEAGHWRITVHEDNGN